MLAGELALAGVDVAIVERRASQDLTGSRAGGLHARTIEVLDQRGIADRSRLAGQGLTYPRRTSILPLDIGDIADAASTMCSGSGQNHIERILEPGGLAEWRVPIYREREVTGFVQDDTGVDVALTDEARLLRANYLVGLRRRTQRPICKAAGIEPAQGGCDNEPPDRRGRADAGTGTGAGHDQPAASTGSSKLENGRD